MEGKARFVARFIFARMITAIEGRA